MKKIIIAVAVVLCMATATQAQTFDKGSMVGTLGIGFGATYGLPISGALDWSVINLWDDKSHLGLGVLAGLGIGDNYTYVLVGGRISLHYQFIDKLDTYLGTTLGYVVTGESGFGWDAYLGARYYFWDKLGLFLELGAGWSNATLGISYKF
jgi:hypothetical protein